MGKAGARVCVNDLNEEKLQACKAAFKKEGLDVFVLKFDVTDETDVDRGIGLIEKSVGAVDILVNNAGIIKRIPILEMSVSDYKQVIDVDLVAPLIISKRVAPEMIRKTERQNYKYVFNDERIWQKYSISLCFSQRRTKTPYAEYDL